MSEQTDYKNIKLFPGLNSLRFMAAFLVLMHHSETIKSKHGIVNFDWLGLFKNGGNAVTSFCTQWFPHYLSATKRTPQNSHYKH